MVRRGSQVNFLNACSVVQQNFKDRQTVFVTYNTNYTVAFSNTLGKNITDYFAMIGANPRLGQKESTATQMDLAKSVGKSISNVNKFINVCYARDIERGNFLKTSLGLQTYENKAIDRDRQDLFDGVNTYINTLPTYKAELIAKGVADKILTDLLNLATKYKASVTSQTSKKGNSTKLTTEQNNKLDELNIDINGICTIGRIIYEGTAEEDLFNFQKILDSFKAPRSKKETTTETETKDEVAQTDSN